MKILLASDISFNYFNSFPGKEKARECFEEVAQLFSEADFSMINLENVFGEKNDFVPIPKGGPNLISSYEFKEYIDALSPSVIGMANNHARDYGKEPMLKTAEALRSSGYQVIGAGNNIEDAYLPAVLEKDGVHVEIFAVCENEYGFATEELAGSAGYKLWRVRKAIKCARERGSLPIIYFHGGNERNPYPSPGKVEMYRNFVEMGAAAVVAMHTHCPQGIEVYNGAPIIYSMGNFFFPFGGCEEYGIKTWSVGYMTALDITGGGIALDIIPYTFDFDSVKVLSGEERDRMLDYISKLSAPISDAKKIRNLFDSWCLISGIGVTDQPRHVVHVDNFREDAMDSFKKLRVKNASTTSYISINNMFSCEAHNELLRNTFNMIYEERCEAAMTGVEEILKLQRLEF